MRTPTPRAVPAFITAPGSAPSVVGPAPKPLLGPIVVGCEGSEQELRRGSLLIGRGSECELVIQDPLVSRMHARILADEEGVTIEDLYSTNGVYLNGERILQARLLHAGDRVFIGSHHLTVVEVATDPAPAPNTPPSLIPEYQDPPTRPNLGLEGALAIPITARADALDLLGNMARRLANDVKAEQAPRMLGPHLDGILRGASSGLVVPDALRSIASEYAIDLAHWTSDARWLDYVVQLHTVTRCMMSKGTLAALQRSERWVGALSRTLLEYYVGSFATRLSELNTEEKARLAALRRMLKKAPRAE